MMLQKMKGFSVQNRLTLSLFMIAIISILSSCDKHPGFEKTESGIYKRLDKFGDCEIPLSKADFFVMQVSYKRLSAPDTGYTFSLHHHNIHQEAQAGNPIGLKLFAELDSMKCGDKITLILPFSEFDNTYLGAFADTSIYKADEEIELSLDLQKTFTEKEFLSYLMSMAQLEEMPETDAIELYLMKTPKQSYEKHGDCFIRYDKKLGGDSIKAGRNVNLQWNTFLFNGQQLDDTTGMQFVFGKPGQLVGGFQYGLSFLGEGDEATIYLPSYLAFGEGGSSSGIVPAKAPVYFKVKVLDVTTEDEVVALSAKGKKKKPKKAA